MNGLPEDPNERTMFDHKAKLAGGPLHEITRALTILSRAAIRGNYGKVMAIYANECAKAAEVPPVRNALNRAARLVEDEARMFYEEAAEIMPREDESHINKEEWEAHDITKGRAASLRRLADSIRSLRP